MKDLIVREEKLIKRLMCVLLVITLIAPAVLTEAVRNAQATDAELEQHELPLALRDYPDDIKDSNVDLRDMFIVPEINMLAMQNMAEILNQKIFCSLLINQIYIIRKRE